MKIHARRIGDFPKWPMSAYSASAPVTASTMDPKATNAMAGSPRMNLRAKCGERANITPGCCTICAMPSRARIANHSTMMGPNALPTVPVPKRCAENSTTMIATPSGTTRCSKLGLTTPMPSIADITEMAGVITESP